MQAGCEALGPLPHARIINTWAFDAATDCGTGGEPKAALQQRSLQTRLEAKIESVFFK
jgi:hypothetical protein